MSNVVFHNSVSLDGYVAGPNDGPQNPLGDGGMALFNWYFDGDTEVSVPGAPPMKLSKESAAVFTESIKSLGVMVCGRRMFDISNAWGGNPPGNPCIVVTHNPPQEWVKEGSPFIFVNGVEEAIAKASELSGDKPVAISSANIAQQALKAGLLDEIHMALIPVLLGGGVRLFENTGDSPVELETLSVIEAPGVTHFGYRIVK
jgi:dihydrofolate reductase